MESTIELPDAENKLAINKWLNLLLKKSIIVFKNALRLRKSMTEEYDLAVAYRVCPKMPEKEMAASPTDKFRLSEICLKSFKESLGSLKAKIFVLLDNCPTDYENLFLKYFEERDLQLIKLGGIGNQATFGLQIQILSNQTESKIVYFAEDDYLFLPNQFHEIISFLKSNSDIHFISAYDHPDFYNLEFCNHKYEIRTFENHHWRTTVATCLSFLTTKKILLQTNKALNNYYKRNAPDYGVWMSITKFNVLDPFKIIKLVTVNQRYFNMFYWTWRHCAREIIFGKKFKLWVPIPSIATHMEKKFLSPCVRWEDQIQAIERSMIEK